MEGETNAGWDEKSMEHLATGWDFTGESTWDAEREAGVSITLETRGAAERGGNVPKTFLNNG